MAFIPRPHMKETHTHTHTHTHRKKERTKERKRETDIQTDTRPETEETFPIPIEFFLLFSLNHFIHHSSFAASLELSSASAIDPSPLNLRLFLLLFIIKWRDAAGWRVCRSPAPSLGGRWYLMAGAGLALALDWWCGVVPLLAPSIDAGGWRSGGWPPPTPSIDGGRLYGVINLRIYF